MTILVNLVTYGLVFCFALFLKPLALEFNWSRASTAGVFSVYSLTHNLFALITGRLTDKSGPRLVIAVGGFLSGLSMFLMSRATAIWQLYLYYPLIFGWGAASVYGPMMATVSQWFTKKRGMAVAIASMGMGLAPLAFSPLAAWLISSFGWRTAYVIIGATCWFFFIPAVKFAKSAPGQSGQCKKVEMEYRQGLTFAQALKTRTLWMLSFAWLFIFLAYYSIMLHFVSLLTDEGISLLGAGFLQGSIGGASLISRVSMAFLSDKIVRKHILLFSFILQLIMLIWLLFSNKLWMFLLFAIIFGLGVGGWGSVMSAFPADYFGSKATATILGFFLIFSGVGIAIGSYMGGYIFDVTNSYYYMIWMDILAVVLAIVSILALKPPVRKDQVYEIH